MYSYLGISKQAVSQHLQRQQLGLQKEEQLLQKAMAIREKHPMMGCRKISHLIKEPGWGRDKVEQLLLWNSFGLEYGINYHKTTHSVRIHCFKNLIEGLTIWDINQVVQSDITYYFVNGKFYYLVMIIDIYSKRIVGYNVSDNMEARCNEKALQQLIKLRGKGNIKAMIHHSDRGSQYHSKKYLSMLKDCQIQISMCNEAWENAYSERINRTIKEEYLNNYKINSYMELKNKVAQAVKLYNEFRPHWAIGLMTPVEFEKAIQTIPLTERKKMKIYL